MTTHQAVHIAADETSIVTLLRRAQWYRNSATWAQDRVLWNDRMRVADYLEAEARRRTNPSFYRPVSQH